MYFPVLIFSNFVFYLLAMYHWILFSIHLVKLLPVFWNCSQFNIFRHFSVYFEQSIIKTPFPQSCLNKMHILSFQHKLVIICLYLYGTYLFHSIYLYQIYSTLFMILILDFGFQFQLRIEKILIFFFCSNLVWTFISIIRVIFNF